MGGVAIRGLLVWALVMAASALSLAWIYEGTHAAELLAIAGIVSAAPLVIKAADGVLPCAEGMRLSGRPERRIKVACWLGSVAAISLSGFGYAGVIVASILVPVSAYFAANGFVRTSLGYLGRRAGALGVTMSVLALIAVANMGDRPVVAAVAGGSVVAGGGLLLRMRRASTMDGRV